MKRFKCDVLIRVGKFDYVKSGHPFNKEIVQATKDVRTFTGLGLKESKDLVDSIDAERNDFEFGGNRTFILSAEQVGMVTYIQMRDINMHPVELLSIEELGAQDPYIDVSHNSV